MIAETFKAGDEVTVRVPLRCHFVSLSDADLYDDERGRADSRPVIPGERFTIARIDEGRGLVWALPLRAKPGEIWIPEAVLEKW